MNVIKLISRILIVTMLHLCWQSSVAWADMVSTETVIQSQTEGKRERLLILLKRQEMMDYLGFYGIKRTEAEARIHSMTDEEVMIINGMMDEIVSAGTFHEKEEQFDKDEAATYLFILALIVAGMIILTLLNILFGCPLSGKSSRKCFH